MTEDMWSITDTREAINAIGEILAAFLKSGPRYPNHLEDTYAECLAIGSFDHNEHSSCDGKLRTGMWGLS
jgi:hypothetical protein